MPARYETIAGWVNEFGWTSGVELGVFDGATHFYLLKHCPKLSLLGVDLWGAAVSKAAPTASGERCVCQYCNETRRARRAATAAQIELKTTHLSRMEPRSRLVKAATAESADLVDAVDFIFVDADHSREGVNADITAWKSKIRPGGRLIGHDWNMQSVREAVAATLPDHKIETGDDHLWWTDL